jgi:hypothetical protein
MPTPIKPKTQASFTLPPSDGGMDLTTDATQNTEEGRSNGEGDPTPPILNLLNLRNLWANSLCLFFVSSCFALKRFLVGAPPRCVIRGYIRSPPSEAS